MGVVSFADASVKEAYESMPKFAHHCPNCGRDTLEATVIRTDYNVALFEDGHDVNHDPGYHEECRASKKAQVAP